MPLLPIVVYVAMIIQGLSKITDFIGKFVKPSSCPPKDKKDDEKK